MFNLENWFLKNIIQRTNHSVFLSQVSMMIKHRNLTWTNGVKLEATIGWTDEEEDELVELWKEKPCLYLIRSPDYADREKKSKALRDIIEHSKFLSFTYPLLYPFSSCLRPAPFNALVKDYSKASK